MENIRAFLSNINVESILGYQSALVIFLVFILCRKVFAKTILKVMFVFIKNKQKPKDSKYFRIFSKFMIFLGGYLAILILKPSQETLVMVNKVFKIICIIFITNIINSIIRVDAALFRKYINYSKNETVNKFICKIARGIVWIISAYIILKELNYDLTGLVAGLGIGSVIISLAAQDTVKSLLSGAIILTDKPFEIGDYIEVGIYKGNVVDITFRSTRIKALDNSIVTVPNSLITSEYVVNWNKIENRRLEFVLNLSMETTSEKIKDLIEKLKLILKNNPDVLPETVQVNLDAIAAFSSDIKIFLYIDKSDYNEFLNAKEKIYCDILKLIELENIDLAYPTQTVYVKNTEDKNIEE